MSVGGIAERVPDRAIFRITHELLGQLALRNETFKENPLSAEQLGNLIDLVQSKNITGL